MPQRDDRALKVAQLIRQREQPELTILFGSRARGDHQEPTSDIDVMLVQTPEPDDDHKKSAAKAATRAAKAAYGREVPVELVWRTLDEFRINRRYVNSVETNAVRDGVIMPGNPEEYSPSNYEEEETEYAYDWTTYDERLRHAEIHLAELIFMAENDRSDTAIGSHSQKTLEHGMKALLEAHNAPYERTHNIGHLLGNIRRTDTELRELGLGISPDIYTAYEGDEEYRRRRQPLLTEQPGYLEKTVADAELIINRAKAVRART